MAAVDFNLGIRDQFEQVRKNATENEAEEKCFDIVKAQKTGPEIIRAGKIFDETFKKNSIPKFPVSFDKETLYLKGYYKFALAKDSGTINDCVSESIDGSEDNIDTGIHLSVISRSDFNAVLNALYDETRVCTVQIDTVRLIEVANYLKADTLAQALFTSLEKLTKASFSNLLYLSKRINSSPIRYFSHTQKLMRLIGRRFGDEIEASIIRESRETLIDKLADVQITSLTIKLKKVTYDSFIHSRSFMDELRRITSLTELCLPNRLSYSDDPFSSFSPRLVSLQLYFSSIQYISLPTSLTYLKGHHVVVNGLFSNLSRLAKLSLKSCASLEISSLTSLRSLSISSSKDMNIYRVPGCITKLSYTFCVIDSISLGMIHSSVQKLKLKRFQGDLGGGTKLLGTQLTDLTIGGNIPYLYHPAPGRLTDEAIINLPRSLTRLVVQKNFTTNEGYKNLPPLKHLELDIDSTFSKITKEVTQYLPRTLQYLYIANGVFPDEALTCLPKDCEVEML